MKNEKSKLILKGINESTGVPFIKEIHSLDEVKTSGNYIVIARNATSEENGFPKINDKTDCCLCCEAILNVVCCYDNDESQSTNTYGQELTISNKENNTTGTYKRTVGPAGCSEWLMVATGNIALIAQNNDIVKAYNEVSANLDAALGRINKAEATVIKSHNTVLESATVRFDRIEENEVTINAGVIDAAPTAIVYYKLANKFVAADSSGAYWDTWDGMEAYMNFGAICKDKVYLCGRVAYIWNGYTLSDSAAEQGNILKASMSKRLEDLHNNIISLDYETFEYEGGNTYYFDAEIKYGDKLIFKTTTTNQGYRLNFGVVGESGFTSIITSEAGSDKATEWTATASFSKIGIYFPTTVSKGKCTFSVNINKRAFAPNAGKILFNGDINFNFNEKKIEIPQGRLLFGKYSQLTDATEIDISNIESGSHNYVIYYHRAEYKYYIYRTAILGDIYDYDKFVLGSFNAVTKSVYGISTYKINGILHKAVSEETISRISQRNSMADVDVSDTLEKGYIYKVAGSVGQTATVEKAVSAPWATVAHNVVAGDMFTISGTGGNSARLFALTDTQGVLLSIARENKTVSDYPIDIEKDGTLYLNIHIGSTYRITKKQNIYSTLKPAIDTEIDRATATEDSLLTNIENSKKDIFDNVRNSLFSIEKTFSYKAGETFRFPCNANVGFKYTIYVDTDKSGYQISFLKILEDGTLYSLSNRQKEEGITLSYVHTPPVNSYGFAIYFASTASAGKATVKIVAEPIPNQQRFFQFGKTCNCDYTTEHIPAFSLPALGERCNYFYGLYDALVSAYPQYVSKVDCDTELADIGISKPDYLNGYNTYMYKFIPAYTPNATYADCDETDAERLKVFVISGTHPEYIGIWDLYHTLRIICEKWDSDNNLEELRWNCEFYILPCACPYGVENNSRTTYNGVDPNRNMPTENWRVRGSLGDSTYSGETAGSEYESKVLMYYIEQLKPIVFIDHHNTNTGSGENINDGKNAMYVTSSEMRCVDIAAAHISQMTRRWKKRSQTEDELFAGVFPSNIEDEVTIFGFAQKTQEIGARGVYGSECGAIGFTYESNNGLLYKDGVLSYENRQVNTALVSTCATDGFINFLLRVLKTISEN